MTIYWGIVGKPMVSDMAEGVDGNWLHTFHSGCIFGRSAVLT